MPKVGNPLGNHGAECLAEVRAAIVPFFKRVSLRCWPSRADSYRIDLVEIPVLCEDGTVVSSIGPRHKISDAVHG